MAAATPFMVDEKNQKVIVTTRKLKLPYRVICLCLFEQLIQRLIEAHKGNETLDRRIHTFKDRTTI